MWTCRDCGRAFKNTNQWHSCYKPVSISQLLLNKAPNVKEVYDEVAKLFESHDDVLQDVLKSTVAFKCHSAFLYLKPQKSVLKVEMLLDYPLDEFPFERCVQVSKKRYAIFFSLEEKSDLDISIKQIMLKSYSQDRAREK